MLALRKTRAGRGVDLVTTGYAEPLPAEGEVEVAICAAGICGSDLHAVAWDPSYGFMEPFLPLTIGHEFAGRVVAVGAGVTDLVPGDRVVCWPTLPCGTCEGCLAGRPSACEARRIVGLHRDGGFAERVRVPERVLHRIPETLEDDLAALSEPLAIAVNAVDVSGAQAGDRVVVLGPGPIGAAIAFVAQERGAEVLLVGLDDAERLAIASRMGIAATCDLSGTTLDAAVRARFGGRCDRVIEATGAAASVAQGLEVLRPEGVFVAAGIHARPFEIDLSRLVREKKQLRGAHDTTETAFAEAIALLGRRGAALSHLITHRLPLSRGVEAFDLARSGGAMKVLLHPDDLEGQTT